MPTSLDRKRALLMSSFATLLALVCLLQRTQCILEPGAVPQLRVTGPDTPAQFMSSAALVTAAAGSTPPNSFFKLVDGTYTDKSFVDDSYMEFSYLSSYDTGQCSDLCSTTSGCQAFVIYLERDPSENPNALNVNPSSITTAKCALYSAPLTADKALNAGQWRLNFNVVITQSRAYNKKPTNTIDYFYVVVKKTDNTKLGYMSAQNNPTVATDGANDLFYLDSVGTLRPLDDRELLSDIGYGVLALANEDPSFQDLTFTVTNNVLSCNYAGPGTLNFAFCKYYMTIYTDITALGANCVPIILGTEKVDPPVYFNVRFRTASGTDLGYMSETTTPTLGNSPGLFYLDGHNNLRDTHRDSLVIGDGSLTLLDLNSYDSSITIAQISCTIQSTVLSCRYTDSNVVFVRCPSDPSFGAVAPDQTPDSSCDQLVASIEIKTRQM